QTVVAKILQAADFAREVIVERDRELAFDFALGNYRVAQQPIDDRAADAVILAQAIATHGRQSTTLNRALVRAKVAVILRIAAADIADRAHTHAVQIRSRLGRVTLEISV